METKKVKVMLIDDHGNELKKFKKVEDYQTDKSSLKYFFTFVPEPESFSEKHENQQKLIKDAIDRENNKKKKVDILIFDLCLNNHDEKVIRNQEVDKTKWNNILSIKLAHTFTKSTQLILFTSGLPEMLTSFKYKKFCEKNPGIFDGNWGFVSKPYFDMILNQPEINETCVRLCNELKEYDGSSPCNSIECTYWKLVHLYKKALEEDK
jgi:hypothetical protein